MWLRNVVLFECDSHGARPVRTSPRGELADGPWSTRVLAGLAWLSSQPTIDALHPTLPAEALLHRHRPRSAAVISKRRCYLNWLPWRETRSWFAPWRTGRRPTEHAHAGGLGVGVLAANARRAPPYAIRRGSYSQTARQIGGCDFETSWPPHSDPMARDPRAHRPVENTGRRPTDTARASGLGVVVFTAIALHAPTYAVGQGSSSPTPCQVGGCNF